MGKRRALARPARSHTAADKFPHPEPPSPDLMNSSSRLPQLCALLLASVSVLPSGFGQTAPAAPLDPVSPAQLARYDRDRNGVLDAAERRALATDEAAASDAVTPQSDTGATRVKGDILTLNPFEVVTDRDDGFAAVNAGTATKLGLDMKDMAAPYSVMTGEFIKAMGITDLQEAVMWSTNGAPVLDGQGADLFGGGSNVTPSSMYNVRGWVINAGQQRNFFLTAGISDTYNIERIDFGRGPNAVLFNVGANEALGGGISTQGKRARFDRNADTVELKAGSFDYYRGSLDINRVLSDRLAVRANAMLQKKNGWMEGQFEDRRGLTLTGTYRFSPKTELRVETIWDKTERSNVALPLFDNVSGWDGTTVFDGPITNRILSGLDPTSAGGGALTTSFRGNGNREGVWRENGNIFLYDPATNSVSNWIHTGSTRRGDENENVPLYFDGFTWSRDGNASLLPFGTGGGSGGNSRTPGLTANGGAGSLLQAIGLSDSRFDRAIANSDFSLPGKRTTITPGEPLFIERTKNANFGLTHQFSDVLLFEVTGDVNTVQQRQVASHLGLRTAFIDLNQTLPNGTPNPHFLDPYSQTDVTRNFRKLDNFGIRANLAYIKDLGRWGKYTFSLIGAYSGRDVEYRRFTRSVALAADPREWHAGGQQLRVRYYWNDSARPFGDLGPTTLYNRVPEPGNNSYLTSTTQVAPRWVIGDWSDRRERTKSGIFAFAARYFDNKLVVSPGLRVDSQLTEQRFRPTSWGFLPNDPDWDGVTLDDRYWRSDAPADWFTMTYLPKNPDGTPRSATPVLANRDRFTTGGVNDVNPAAAQYANDRFRNDYNPPAAERTVVNTNLGVAYHILPWVSLKLSYGDAYKPADPNRVTLSGEEAEPETGVAYEGGLTFNLLRNRLTVTPRYYFNRKENILSNSPVIGTINALYSRNAWNDPSPDGRNQLGHGDITGADYAAVKNDGYELEIVGRLSRGWRVMANYGTGQRVDYDRWKATPAFVRSRADDFLEVLTAAGGALDTSATFNSLKSASAPGYAVPDPNIPDSMLLSPTNERRDAINNYNTLWTQYDQIASTPDTVGIKRMKINLFTDYTIQEGRFRGLRVGLGWQYVDKDIAGYRSADTIANPNYDPSQPVAPTNLPWADDPSVDANTPIWVKRPSEMNMTLTYTKRLKPGIRLIGGKEVTFHLNIRNLLNKQGVYYQDDGVVARPPNGDLTAPNRVSVPGRIARFQVPINFEFTTTLKL